MSDPAIIVENISKLYKIGNLSSGNLRESISKFFSKTEERSTDFYALKNISFSISQGETIGIIGRNGAGKSTLLKILSQITHPSEGRVEIYGRVGSLLEVGTGFHSELTGRENIFLNGTILGMSRKEVKKKFDEIVDFSGIEKFLDLPVKKYSSGMTVRLAFSVAAHLEPEILIVDEVLAVGDAEFQKKCLGKMKSVSDNKGRTVLFVSHNIGAVSKLCTKSIYLENGKLKMMGDTGEIINQYHISNSESISVLDRRHLNEWQSKNHFTSFCMYNSNFKVGNEFKHNEEFYIHTKIHLPNPNKSYEFALSIYDKFKNRIFTIHENISVFKMVDNQLDIKIKIPDNFLTPGYYSWIMCLNHPGVEFMDLHDDFYNFSIIDNGSSFFQYQPDTYGNVFAKYTIEN